ncbi:MAG: beta-galactosidase [Silicimonas sp.]|nr:beta-galactosidase [Silicimonas sp.]
MKPELGVCYYPEHWPEEQWADDARRMVEAGLTWVRIGEFAWSRLEPKPGELTFDWLSRAIETLGVAGLKVVLGTPTATPPRWMVDKHPDMLAVDAEGRVRKFGSRRHYCFSHQGYIAECRRIVTLLGKTFGESPHVAAWQIDNEYGCHDTTLSYSSAALDGFRDWCAERYGDIGALNDAWGNVFWSMEYSAFDQIELPNLTVTEPNPAHVLAFRRYSSDQVVAFNRAQVEVLRDLTEAPLIHNYMGKITDFDHFAVGKDLDIASWDSYPLGFLLDRVGASEDRQLRYLRQGDPDFQAFHHDLYRSVGKGRWWVMEQQPGPVNWAPHNPAPLPGMVRLWTWEAIAHGAEVVSYFRWRQVPFGQEQMHAGLLGHDGRDARGLKEAGEVAGELSACGSVEQGRASVALVFDYASVWAWTVQPQGESFDYFALCFSAYRAFRRAGVSVDIVEPGASLDGYALVLAPGVFSLGDEARAAFDDAEGIVVYGPRCGAKTDEMSIALPLPAGLSGVDVRVSFVESLPGAAPVPVRGGGTVRHWAEAIETDDPVLMATEAGAPVLVGERNLYLSGWPDDALWDRIVAHLGEAVGLDIKTLPEGVRLREIPSHRFLFNYGAGSALWDGEEIPAAGVLIRPL